MKHNIEFFIKNIISKQTEVFKTHSIRVTNEPEVSIWALFTQFANQAQAQNLGQGFPNEDPPEFLLNAFTKYINTKGIHQYTPPNGHPELIKTIQKIYSPIFNRELNANGEIQVTNGAQAAISNVFMGLVNPGDEVVFFEPTFTQYFLNAKIAQAKAIGVPLIQPKAYDKSLLKSRAPDYLFDSTLDSWTFNIEDLRKAINKNTKLLMINTPHNPTGKIFSQRELEQIAEVLKDYPQVIVLADEVYDTIVLDKSIPTLPRIANIPGMFERTISMYSAGKMFQATGLRVGFCIGPKELLRACATVNNSSQFCMYAPLQLAVRDALEFSYFEPYEGFANYHEFIRDVYYKRRRTLMEALVNSPLDLNVFVPQGGWFAIMDVGNSKYDVKNYLENDEKLEQLVLSAPKDIQYSVWLACEKKVFGIPLNPFYSQGFQENYYKQNLVRIAICKKADEFIETGKRLQ